MIAITNEEKYLAKIAGEEITTPEPVLRKEQYLSAIANGEGTIPELPYTREEQYLAIIAGENYAIPTPETRLERYMAKACGLDIDTPTPITNVEYYWAIIAEGGSWQITTLTGTLPLSFLSKGEALTDYRIYGTSEGAGVETENLWNPNTSFTEGKFINPSGDLSADPGWRASDYVGIDSNKQYTFFVNTTAAPAAHHAFYNSNKQFVSSIKAGTQTFITPNDAVYARFSCRKTTTEIMHVEGPTAPETYIPSGYKLPLTITSGAQSSTYPLYIGSTKLGEEEYVDFGEQKIYRTILLTTHDNKDFITSDNKRFCVRRSNNA